MKGSKCFTYSLKKDLQPFITGISKCWFNFDTNHVYTFLVALKMFNESRIVEVWVSEVSLYWCTIYVRCHCTDVPYMWGVTVLMYHICEVSLYWCTIYVRCHCTDVPYMWGVTVLMYHICEVSLYWCTIYVRCHCTDVPYSIIYNTLSKEINISMVKY